MMNSHRPQADFMSTSYHSLLRSDTLFHMTSIEDRQIMIIRNYRFEERQKISDHTFLHTNLTSGLRI